MEPFTPVNELERLLVPAFTDPAARPAFYRALPESQLFVITEGLKPSLSHVIQREGRIYIPVFTSIDRLKAAVTSEVEFVAMKGRDLLNALRDKDLVLNPNSAYGKVIPQEEVQSILAGSILAPPEMRDIGVMQAFIGQPRDYPHHLIDALSRLFSKGQIVKRAYLAQIFIPDTDKTPQTLIGLEVEGDYDRVAEEAGFVVGAVAKTGEGVNFIQINASANDPFSQYMLRETNPFYKR
jgi:hypothetical protein